MREPSVLLSKHLSTPRRWRKRLRLARRFKVLPWHIPENVVMYLDGPGPTEADIARGHELAEKHGW